MEFSNDMVEEFLDLYEKESIIWCPSHPDNKNRAAVNLAWERIRDNMSVECTIQDLKRKKESLMATYRNIVNKISLSHTSPGGTYTTTWFAFKKLDSFLHNIYVPKSAHETDSMFFSSADNEEVEDADYTFEENKNEIEVEAFVEPIAVEDYKRTITKRKRRTEEFDPLDDQESSSNHKNAKSSSSVLEDKNSSICSLYGQLIAQKLETLSQAKRIIVMNEIDNLLFRASMEEITNNQADK